MTPDLFNDSRLPAAFWSKVAYSQDGCWLWDAAISTTGYGNFTLPVKRTASAHRVAYLALVGEIPKGWHIDHQCRQRACVRPTHLRAVTRKQNMENVDAYATSRTGVRGVSWTRWGWRVRVGHLGKNYGGGTYPTIEQAEQAAIALRNQLHTNNVLDRVDCD